MKSLLHNIVVVIVGLGVAGLGAASDSLLSWPGFKSFHSAAAGCALIAVGFLLRFWATFLFYERQMKVISLVPQNHLITTSPYRFTRNPLSLGGKDFIIGGAALFLGSPGGLILTGLATLAADWMIRREEKQLEHDFGEEWRCYKKRVRRWL